MKRNEKEYCMKQAAELKGQMINATRNCDKIAFSKAYNTAQRYMTRPELRNMMVMFITHMKN